MFELDQGLTLPDPEERRRILERAGVLITEARMLLERLDQGRRKVRSPRHPDKDATVHHLPRLNKGDDPSSEAQVENQPGF